VNDIIDPPDEQWRQNAVDTLAALFPGTDRALIGVIVEDTYDHLEPTRRLPAPSPAPAVESDSATSGICP
jgi:hypothetical protein